MTQLTLKNSITVKDLSKVNNHKDRLLFWTSVTYNLICFIEQVSGSKIVKNKKFLLLFISSFLILYFTVFVRIKQVVVKVYLKYSTCHRIEVLHPIIYHPYIYRIIIFELGTQSLDKMKKLVPVSLKASSSFLDQVFTSIKIKFNIYKCYFSICHCYLISSEHNFFDNFFIVLDNNIFQAIKAK